MTWAHDVETGLPVYIMELSSARNGSKCGCECSSCGHPLKATNAGKAQGAYVQKPHFKHRAGVVKSSCLILAARAAALRLLVDDGMIDLPSRSRSSSWQGLSGAAYQGTATVQGQRRALKEVRYLDRTNAVLTLDDGRQVTVKLTGTNMHQSSTSKDSTDAGATIFIDINDPLLAGLDPKELRSRLKLLPGVLCWRNHWDDPSLERKAAEAAMAQAQEMLDWPEEVSELDLRAVPPELRRETVLHLTVKHILAASGHIRVPEFAIQEVAGIGSNRSAAADILVKPQSLLLSNARLEHRLGKMIPDVCVDAVDAEGIGLGPLCVEVTVTNGFDPERLERVRRENVLTLEIDLSNAFGRISRSDLIELVIDGLAGKRWLHHPDLIRRQDELRAAARAASEAKAQELDEAAWTRAIRTQVISAVEAHEEAAEAPPGAEVAEADLDRCRLTVQARRASGWVPDGDLLDGLLSLRHGKGLGCHHGLTAAQVAHKLRCTLDTRLHSLLLIALNEFGVPGGESDSAVLADWAATTRGKVRAGDSMWLPPIGALSLLKELIPELGASVDRLNGFLRRPISDLKWKWTTGELLASRLQRADAMRRNLYRNGAYRLYAPRVDYDRVMAEARDARRRQESLSAKLAHWSREYSLGDDLTPILNVLREAGLVS